MLPPTFHIDITRSGLFTYRLATSQIIPVHQKKAFEFFEDPPNLCDITPIWIDFCLLNKDSNSKVHENAAFDYTTKFLGIKIRWKSRIIDDKPPERFTDTQVMGPHKSWGHLHKLETVPDGTLMRDNVTYKLHFPALILHHFLIRKKLIDIFTYRAVNINAWAEKMK